MRQIEEITNPLQSRLTLTKISDMLVILKMAKFQQGHYIMKGTDIMATEVEVESKRKITLDMMIKFIDENHPEDKEWFKKVAMQDANGNDTGKYNHHNAVEKFCEKYASSYEIKSNSKSGTNRLNNW